MVFPANRAARYFDTKVLATQTTGGYFDIEVLFARQGLSAPPVPKSHPHFAIPGCALAPCRPGSARLGSPCVRFGTGFRYKRTQDALALMRENSAPCFFASEVVWRAQVPPVLRNWCAAHASHSVDGRPYGLNFSSRLSSSL